MSELADAYTEQGELTAQKKTKMQIFQDGDWRLVTHVWVLDSSRQRLLVQQRAHKGIFDDLWDVTIGGGVHAGEPTIQAAVRELDEELGIQARSDELTLLGRWKVPKHVPELGLMMQEWSDTYALVRDIAPEDLHLQRQEVAAAKWVTLQYLHDQINDPETYKLWVPHSVEYYNGVADVIRGSK